MGREVTKKWQKENKSRCALHRRRSHAKAKLNPGYRIKNACRSRIYDALLGLSKSDSILGLIGCSVEQFRAHIETQFLVGMSWENYGMWEIDHKRPCVTFDLTDPNQQRQCFHFSNCQPLWKRDNRSKGDKYVQQ